MPDAKKVNALKPVSVVVAVFGLAFLILGPLHPPGDGDLYWQRWLGDLLLKTHALPTMLGPETFTSSGSPWVPQEWLFSLMLAILAAHGMFAVFAVAVASVPAIVLITVAIRARKLNAADVAIALALVFCGIAMENSFGVRAQVLGWGCFAAFMWALEMPSALVYLCIPIVCLWANVHASVMIAPVLALVRALGLLADGGHRSPQARRTLLLAPLLAAATLATPLGWHLPLYSVQLVSSPIRAFIVEWQPTNFTDFSFTLGALPLFLAVVILGLRRFTASKADGLVFLVLFAAMMEASRNIPLFAIAAAPAAAQAMSGIAIHLKRFVLETRTGRALTVASSAAVAAFALLHLAGPSLHLPGASKSMPHPIYALPILAIELLEHSSQPHRLFCEDFAWCSIALGAPDIRVFIEGRADPYPVAVWRDNMAIVKVQHGWRHLLDKYGVDAIITARAGRLTSALRADRHWHQDYRDASFVIYLRSRQGSRPSVDRLARSDRQPT